MLTNSQMLKSSQVLVLSTLIFLSVFLKLCAANVPIEEPTVETGRSALPAFNPLAGVWQSASRMLGQGVHQFRQSLQEGVKVAQMLKEDVDEGVTQLISKNKGTPFSSLSGGSPSQQPDESNSSIDEQQLLREGVLGGLLRFMGVNSNHVGVIALNVLIIFAEWITSSLLGKNDASGFPQSRMVKTNLLEWVTKGHNEKIEKLLHDAKDKALPNNIIETLQEKTGNTTSCVQLLICKMSPLIWGVQKTVDKQLHPDLNNSTPKSASSQETGRGSNKPLPSVMDTLYNFIPNKNAFVNFGDHCEKRFPTCQLLKFPKKTSLI